MILNAFSAVLMVLIIIGAGYYIAFRKWASKKVLTFISNIIVNVTLPCTIVTAFLTSLSADKLAGSYIYIIAAFVAVGITYVISLGVARITKIDKTRRGVFTALFSFSNSVFIGLPVATAIFGEEGLIFAVFYFIGNSTLMNSIGFFAVQKDGRLMRGEAKEKQSVKVILKRIFQPPIIAIIVGFVFVFANVALPDFLGKSLQYLGNITTPLSLIFIGIVLHNSKLSSLKTIEKPISIALIGRFILSPLIMFLVCRALNVDTFASQVLLVQMSLPAMVQTAIFAEISGADTQLATKGVIITTLLSFIAIPIYVAMF